MSRAGGTLTRSVSLPIVAGFAVAFKAATDVEESLNKVNVVFQGNAREIDKWSTNAADRLGMARQEALEALGTFGNLFRSMEIGLQPATEMSKGIVQLAADLASFNNASPEEALLALRSGLVGEIEPLRRFGVNLTQARIEAEAVRLGLAKVGDELDAGQKAQAAYSIILKDSTLAQGDFAETADSGANRMRRLRAQALDLAAGFGERLLPVGIRLLEFGQRLLERFQKLSPSTQDLIIKAGVLAAALGPVLVVFGKLASGLGGIIGLVGKVVGLFTAHAAAAGASTVATNANTTAVAANAAATRSAALATAAWTAAIGLAVVAGIKLRNYLNIDNEQGEKWAATVKDGTNTIAEFRAEQEKLRKQVGSFESPFDIDELQAIDAIDHAIENVSRAYRKHVGTILDGTGAQEKWNDALRSSGPMSIKQKRNLATLLVTQDRYGVTLSESSEFTLRAFLRTGDYRSALRLLKGSLDGVLGPLKNALTYTQQQGEAAGDAAQNNRRYAYWLDQISRINPGTSGVATFVPPGAGGQTTHAGGITQRFHWRSVHERGSEAILPLEGAEGRRVFERLAAAGAGGGARGPLRISGELAIVNGRAYVRGIATEELDGERRFDARLARRRSAE